MKLQIGKIKDLIKIKDLPVVFERYEFFVIIFGTVIIFLFAGFVFYNNAYKTVLTIPEVEVELPSINSAAFDEILQDLEQKKQPLPNQPVVDPFR